MSKKLVHILVDIARGILSIAAGKSWFFAQYDFNTAYLNARLDKEIYIFAPSGMADIPNVNKNKRVIYRLRRGLYRLKQAGKLWHEEISKTLKHLGYSKHAVFPSTFIKTKKGKVISIIGLFVDDMIVTTKTADEKKELADKLMKTYKMKEIVADENGMQRFLGINMKVARDSDNKVSSIRIDQNEYIPSIIAQYQVEGSLLIKTPLPRGYYFNPKDKPLTITPIALKRLKTEYKKQIGLLIYLSVMTRPDICHGVNYLGQFSEYPHEELFQMINRLFVYLINTQSYSLEYKNIGANSIRLETYTDSDYAQGQSRKPMNG
jgi:hypothetical protein